MYFGGNIFYSKFAGLPDNSPEYQILEFSGWLFSKLSGILGFRNLQLIFIFFIFIPNSLALLVIILPLYYFLNFQVFQTMISSLQMYITLEFVIITSLRVILLYIRFPDHLTKFPPISVSILFINLILFGIMIECPYHLQKCWTLAIYSSKEQFDSQLSSLLYHIPTK
jgi:hypothetical protein